MTNRVIGPGVTLPSPQIPYPANLTPTGIGYTPGSNEVTLAPGDSVQIPSGDWLIDIGKYSVLEFLDPVMSGTTPTNIAGVWRPIRSQRGTFTLRSDGFNYRISNLLGCAVAAVVTAGGASYVQASTTVTPSTGNSTWVPVIGGALGAFSVQVAGSGYGLAPLVFIPQPPAPGVPATAYATLSGSTLGSITLTNMGAGYSTIPPITILPSPYDPNLASITSASAVASLSGSGQLRAVLCTNHGAPVASSMTLTIAGVGTSGTASPVFLTTITDATAATAGSGSFTGAAVTTIGGVPVSNTFTNPQIEYTDFLPRPAQVKYTVTGGALSAPVIIDGGMFMGTASPLLLTYGGNPAATFASVTLTQGSVSDTIIIQPL